MLKCMKSNWQFAPYQANVNDKTVKTTWNQKNKTKQTLYLI